METLNPLLNLVIEVKTSLELGFSVRQGIMNFLSSDRSEFRNFVARWLTSVDAREPTRELLAVKTVRTRIVLTTLEKGLLGAPLLPALTELEVELFEFVEAEMDMHAKSLAFKMMVPLFLFMFPAWMLLLLGPLMSGFAP